MLGRLLADEAITVHEGFGEDLAQHQRRDSQTGPPHRRDGGCQTLGRSPASR